MDTGGLSTAVFFRVIVINAIVTAAVVTGIIMVFGTHSDVDNNVREGLPCYNICPQGATGAVGPGGGTQGDAGPPGAPGPAGSPGAPGPAGPGGPAGPSGFNGSPGTPGNDATPCVPCINGTQGIVGPAGACNCTIFQDNLNATNLIVSNNTIFQGQVNFTASASMNCETGFIPTDCFVSSPGCPDLSGCMVEDLETNVYSRLSVGTSDYQSTPNPDAQVFLGRKYSYFLANLISLINGYAIDISLVANNTLVMLSESESSYQAVDDNTFLSVQGVARVWSKQNNVHILVGDGSVSQTNGSILLENITPDGKIQLVTQSLIELFAGDYSSFYRIGRTQAFPIGNNGYSQSIIDEKTDTYVRRATGTLILTPSGTDSASGNEQLEILVQRLIYEAMGSVAGGDLVYERKFDREGFYKEWVHLQWEVSVGRNNTLYMGGYEIQYQRIENGQGHTSTSENQNPTTGFLHKGHWRNSGLLGAQHNHSHVNVSTDAKTTAGYEASGDVGICDFYRTFSSNATNNTLLSGWEACVLANGVFLQDAVGSNNVLSLMDGILNITLGGGYTTGYMSQQTIHFRTAGDNSTITLETTGGTNSSKVSVLSSGFEWNGVQVATTSDERTKVNKTLITEKEAEGRILQAASTAITWYMSPDWWTNTDRGDRPHYGWEAHVIAETYPGAVYGERGGQVMQQVKFHEIIADLVVTMAKLLKQNKELAKKVDQCTCK